MQPKTDTSKANTGQRRNPRNNRDSALLYLMLIRDEIVQLPRPQRPQNLLNKKLVSAPPTPALEQQKSTSTIPCKALLAEERKLNDRLLDLLDAYNQAIQKIDKIALHALRKFHDVQVGGRRPKLDIKEIAEEIALNHFEKYKKLPTSKSLLQEVRRSFFKADSFRFIEKVKKDMDPKTVARYSIDPAWSYWGTVDGLTSDRAMSAILTQLRYKMKNNSPV